MWKKTAKKEIKSSKISKTLILDEEKIDYVLIRDTYKTLRLRVKIDASLEVKAPKRYQQIYIDAFLQKKASWIIKKRKENLKKGIKPELDFSQGASCFCLGKEFFFYYGVTKIGEIYGIKKFGEIDKIEKIHGIWKGDESAENLNVAVDDKNTHNEQTFSDKQIFVRNIPLLEFWQSGVLGNRGHGLDGSSLDGQCIAVQSLGSSFDEQSFCCEELYQSFVEIANTVHRRFSLVISLDPGFVALVLMPAIFIKTKTYTEANYLTGMHVWRKRTAELFLQVCLDRIWQNLCGVRHNDATHNDATHNDATHNDATHNDATQNNSNSNNTMQNKDGRTLYGQEKSEENNSLKEVQAIFCKINKPKLFVRVLSRRFGSCSTKGKICLARHLISFPPPLIEYVIIHECCHLVHMNHSKNFYELLDICCIDAKKKREALWDWSRKHPNF